MSEPRIIGPPAQIPRFVADLDAIAVAHGLQVEHEIAPYDDGSDMRLWSRWSGPKDAIYGLGLLSRSQHLPLKKGYLAVPPGNTYDFPVLCGEVTITGDKAVWDLDFGPSNCLIEMQCEVEVIRYDDSTLYYGAVDALVASGIDRKKLPAGQRTAKASSWRIEECPAWRSRRLPNKNVLYREESPSAFAKRLAEQRTWAPAVRRIHFPADIRPTFLRLVVDNTRPLPGSEEHLGPDR